MVVSDEAGRYLGIVETTKAFDPQVDSDAPIATLASTDDPTLSPADDVRAVMGAFDVSEAPYLAVIDEQGTLLGTLSERFVRRRYTEEVEKAQRDLFGE